MPVNEYYKGHGSEVMSDMQARYGSEGGKRVFYATAEKRKMKPGQKGKKALRKRRHAKQLRKSAGKY